jgi:hypothetical protein
MKTVMTQEKGWISQAKAASALVGRRVRFHHDPEPTYRVTGTSTRGLVSLAELPGWFAPHLFTVVVDPGWR